MNVYRVTLTDRNPANDTNLFALFECSAPTIEFLASDLNDGLIVVGQRLFTRKTAERGVFEVYARKTFAISKAIVACIELPFGRLVEYEDEAVP